MLILAIDTALDACAAGVLDTEAGRLIAQESQAMKRGHAEALMPLVARVMKESGIGFAALDRVAATTGPGSFTGLRVGLSALKRIRPVRRVAFRMSQKGICRSNHTWTPASELTVLATSIRKSERSTNENHVTSKRNPAPTAQAVGPYSWLKAS